jgi:hypothetical protein
MSKLENSDPFSALSGTGSSRSAKAYRIRSGDHEYTASEWLAGESNCVRALLKPIYREMSGHRS